jgi:hypothetical protein
MGNSGINTYLLWNTTKKNYKYTLEMSWEFLSSNWKYWYNCHALTTVCLIFLFLFSQAGAPWDLNSYFCSSSTGKSLRNTALYYCYTLKIL